MIKIAVLKGDGIGPEIIDSALAVLAAVAEKYGIKYTLSEGVFGGAAIDEYGVPFPDEVRELVKNVDAILLGSVGGPRWDAIERERRPESGLLDLRKTLGLYCNIRPVKYYPALAEQVIWKAGLLDGVDLVIFRELTGGAYFGEKAREGNRAYDIIDYSKDEIERLVRKGFEMAQMRTKKVHSIDKANVLETSRLWRETVEEIAEEYPEIAVEHLYVDNAAISLITDPGQFDVIVTENMFGDILSDEAAALAGSLGMLPSASLGGEVGLYEPAHGSAPDIAGEDKANPLATILSLAMMFRISAGEEDAALAIEQAIESVLAAGLRTADIAQGGEYVGTKEITAEIIKRI